MAAGTAFDIDVDLNLVSDDRDECIVHPGTEAVIEGGVDGLRCGHKQTLCIPCYDRNIDKWTPGDACWCYTCPKLTNAGGVFTGWIKL